MRTEKGSSSRTSEYTEVHKCGGCGRAFWAKSSWNGVRVECPHCSQMN
jgi:DNA-directed RNA polymerase subunit RPC12/RpoP